MADVNVTIELEGLERAVRGLDRLESALDDLERAGARVSKSMRGATDAVNKQASSVEQSTKKTREATKQSNLLGRAWNTMTKNLTRLGGKLRVTAASLGVFLSSVVALRQEIVALGATIGGVFTEVQLENARQRLSSVADNTKITRQQMSAFRQVANDTQTRLTGMVDQMAAVSASVQATGGSFQDSIDIMEGFIKAGSDMGQSTSDIADTLENLNELVKQGTFEMGDLADALEFTNNPTQVLADSFNTTEARIRDMIDAGVELNRSALRPVSEQLQQQSSISDTLTGAFNELINAAVRLFDIFNQTGVIDAIISQMQRLTDLLRSAQAEQFIIRIGNAVTDFINNTLPQFVQNTVNSWQTILDVIRGAAGTLIGLAAGGIPGGILGAIIGAHDEARKAVIKLGKFTGEVLTDLVRLWNGAEEDISPTARAIAAVIETVVEMIQNIAEAMRGGFTPQDFREFQNDLANLLGDAIVGAVETAFQRGIDAVRNFNFRKFSQGIAESIIIGTGLGEPQQGDVEVGRPRLARDRVRTGDQAAGFTPMGQLPRKEVVGQPQVQPFVDMRDVMAELNRQMEFLERNTENAGSEIRNHFKNAQNAIRGVDLSVRMLNNNVGNVALTVAGVAISFGTLEQAAVRVGNTIRTSFVSAFASVLKGAKSFGDAMKAAFQSIVDQLIQELARLATQQIFRLFLRVLGFSQQGQGQGATFVGRGGKPAGGGLLGGGGLLSTAGGLLSGGGAGTAAAGVGGNVPGLAGTGGGTGAGAAGVSTGAALAGVGSIFANVLAAEDTEAAAGAAFGGIIGGAFGGPIGAAFGSTIGGALFQTGGSQVVSQPTMIGVGEHGQPEKVTVEPLSGGAQGEKGGPSVVVQGPLIVDEIGLNRFSRRIEQAQRKERRRRV